MGCFTNLVLETCEEVCGKKRGRESKGLVEQKSEICFINKEIIFVLILVKI